MIRSFTHKGLRKFFETGSNAGIRPEHKKRLSLILGVLSTAVKVQDMALPGLGLHRLTSPLSGFWSVSVSGNWRVILDSRTMKQATLTTSTIVEGVPL